ncbi:hypothetical protein PHK61_13895 [Actinomycetospora lutea]|uniref:hypothetical protein n=1 Tax=Actinomycetospora lutea TaxID=663604 RepID=UPI0023654E73|nr:hypothetical protein [Actinomycetospora lutea]MDD7939511.1 hypothetical protein [Actinomycetospora lutea]
MESDEVHDTATVDLLRRAADELERLHARVPPGRWSTRGLLATRPEVVAEDAAGRTEHVAEARQRSARWIVAMSPAVAPPLVAWLRETAEVLDRPRPGVTASTSAAVALASELLERLGPRP